MYSVFNSIVKDIKSLRGSEVRVFGQPTILSDSVDKYTIDILDVLNSLEDYVINLEDYVDYRYNEEIEDEEEYCIFEDMESDNIDGILDVLENYGYISDVCGYKGDNSYNWSSPISNDFDFKIYKKYDDIKMNYNDDIFVEFKVHRFGDVRVNYTDSVLLHFDSDYEFYEVLSENNIYTSITVDGVDYDVNIIITSDSYEVWDVDGNYICQAYGDEDDIINCIKENVA